MNEENEDMVIPVEELKPRRGMSPLYTSNRDADKKRALMKKMGPDKDGVYRYSGRIDRQN